MASFLDNLANYLRDTDWKRVQSFLSAAGAGANGNWGQNLANGANALAAYDLMAKQQAEREAQLLERRRLEEQASRAQAAALDRQQKQQNFMNQLALAKLDLQRRAMAPKAEPSVLPQSILSVPVPRVATGREYPQRDTASYTETIRQVDPAVGKVLEDVARYRLPFKDAFGNLGIADRGRVISVLQGINPQYRSDKYDSVRKMRDSLSDTERGVGADFARGNTAMAHLEQMDQAFEKLSNTDIPAANLAKNFLGSHIGFLPGNEHIDAYNLSTKQLASELERSIVGGRPAVTMVKLLKESLGPNATPAQHREASRMAKDLYYARAYALVKSVYNKTDGEGVPVSLLRAPDIKHLVRDGFVKLSEDGTHLYPVDTRRQYTVKDFEGKDNLVFGDDGQLYSASAIDIDGGGAKAPPNEQAEKGGEGVLDFSLGDLLRYTGGLGSSVIRGATLGGSDLLSETLDDASHDFSKDHPIIATGAEVAGSVLPILLTGGVGAGAAAARLAARPSGKMLLNLLKYAPSKLVDDVVLKALPKADTAVANVARLAGTGAAGGGIYNAATNYRTDREENKGVSVPDRIAEGAVLGGILGPALGLSIQGVGALKNLAGRFLKRGDSTQNALRGLEKELASKKKTLPSILEQLQKVDPKTGRLLDADPVFPQQVAIDQAFYPENKALLRQALEDDLTKIAKEGDLRTSNLVDDVLGTKAAADEVTDAIETLKNTRSERASPLYDAFYNKTYDLYDTPEVLDIFQQVKNPQSIVKHIYGGASDRGLNVDVRNFLNNISRFNQISRDSMPVQTAMRDRGADSATIRQYLLDQARNKGLNFNVSGAVLDAARKANESANIDIAKAYRLANNPASTPSRTQHLDAARILEQNLPEFAQAQQAYRELMAPVNLQSMVDENLLKAGTDIDSFNSTLEKLTRNFEPGSDVDRIVKGVKRKALEDYLADRKVPADKYLKTLNRELSSELLLDKLGGAKREEVQALRERVSVLQDMIDNRRATLARLSNQEPEDLHSKLLHTTIAPIYSLPKRAIRIAEALAGYYRGKHGGEDIIQLLLLDRAKAEKVIGDYLREEGEKQISTGDVIRAIANSLVRSSMEKERTGGRE